MMLLLLSFFWRFSLFFAVEVQRMQKCSISSILCEEDLIGEFGSLFSCQTGKENFQCGRVYLLMRRLGVSIFNCLFSKKREFSILIDKLRDRFRPWCTGFLYQSGRLILAQVMLSAVLTFHLMSLTPLHGCLD